MKRKILISIAIIGLGATGLTQEAPKESTDAKLNYKYQPESAREGLLILMVRGDQFPAVDEVFERGGQIAERIPRTGFSWRDLAERWEAWEKDYAKSIICRDRAIAEMKSMKPPGDYQCCQLRKADALMKLGKLGKLEEARRVSPRPEGVDRAPHDLVQRSRGT